MPTPPWLVEDVEPVDPETFAFAFTLASAAGAGAVPSDVVPSSAGKSVLVDTGERVRKLVFNDTPMLRVMDAILHVVGGDRERALPYVHRVFALGNLIRDGSLSAWTRQRPDGDLDMRDVIFDAAAEAPCHRGEFDREDLLRRIKEAADAEDAADAEKAQGR